MWCLNTVGKECVNAVVMEYVGLLEAQCRPIETAKTCNEEIKRRSQARENTVAHVGIEGVQWLGYVISMSMGEPMLVKADIQVGTA